MSQCQQPTEVWARVCGYFRPLKQWHKGKKAEFNDRLNYDLKQEKAPETGK